jgi:nicotinate phosphoribosyltransferase
MASRRFYTANDDEIRDGKVADVYFQRTRETLRARSADKTVVAEMRARSLPEAWPWAVLTGVEEVARLLEGLDIRVWAPPEGTLVRAGEPVLTIEGPYTTFGHHETAFLGLLCEATGVATKSARCRIAAGERTLLSFGARRMHPALAPMIERACYLGGCDGVSTILAAERMGIPPTGTMPHALILILGDTLAAAEAFDESMPAQVPRIVLIDTFQDEKFEALRIAEALRDRLYGVRFDTPSSRRGDLRALMEEVRWELDLRGFRDVRFYASGGLDEHRILELNAICDGYGVGTSLSNAPTVNFAFDIVEIEGEWVAKRGKMSGAKWIARCPACGAREVIYWRAAPGRCTCGAQREIVNQPLIENGRIVAPLPTAPEIRAYVLAQLRGVTLE